MNEKSDQERPEADVLAEAIGKAVQNGWEIPGWINPDWQLEAVAQWLINVDKIPKLVYDHRFAKALWGSGVPDSSIAGDWTTNSINKPTEFVAHRNLSPYEYHLQQMVVADDPIAYLSAVL